jgi:hypothetical protein
MFLPETRNVMLYFRPEFISADFRASRMFALRA